MKSPDDDDSPPQGHDPVAWGASALGALLDHFSARAELFQWEAREAKTRLLRWILSLVIAIAFLVLTYLLLLVALIGWLASALSLGWPLATLVVAGGHLLIAVVLYLLARRWSVSGFFPDSLNEFRRDREWLRRKSESSRPR